MVTPASRDNGSSPLGPRQAAIYPALRIFGRGEGLLTTREFTVENILTRIAQGGRSPLLSVVLALSKC